MNFSFCSARRRVFGGFFGLEIACKFLASTTPFLSLVSPHTTDNSHLLTIQPDLSTTTMTYQGSLCPRQDGPNKFQIGNGHLLSPLGSGRHTLHHSSPSADPVDFVSRFSTQSFFRSLPRSGSSMAYGTFNFLGGRLMIPNTGEDCRKGNNVPGGDLGGKPLRGH